MDNINLQKDHLIRICVNFNNPTNLHENLNISRNTAHKTSPLSFETTEKPSWHKSLICAYQFPEIALRPLFSRKLKTTYKKKSGLFLRPLGLAIICHSFVEETRKSLVTVTVTFTVQMPLSCEVRQD